MLSRYTISDVKEMEAKRISRKDKTHLLLEYLVLELLELLELLKLDLLFQKGGCCSRVAIRAGCSEGGRRGPSIVRVVTHIDSVWIRGTAVAIRSAVARIALVLPR